MNQRWWTNEIICIALGINQRYFSSLKNAVKCLVPTSRKLILKNLIIFNLFFLHICFGPHVCIGNPNFRIGVVLWPCSIRNIILLHTHDISPTITNTFFIPTTLRSHATSWLRYRHGPRQTNFIECFSYVPIRAIVSSIAYTRMNRKSPYESPPPVK
jgi:hypothetical protein